MSDKFDVIDAFAAFYKGLMTQSEEKPHEMSAREYLMARTRMCYKYEACEGCPLNIINEKYNCLCFSVESQSQEEAVAVVEKWAQKHPEERSEE